MIFLRHVHVVYNSEPALISEAFNRERDVFLIQQLMSRFRFE